MPILRWKISTAFDRHDVAGLGLVIEMQLDPTSIKLPQYTLDSPLDRRIIGAIASDEFQNNRSERR